MRRRFASIQHIRVLQARTISESCNQSMDLSKFNKLTLPPLAASTSRLPSLYADNAFSKLQASYSDNKLLCSSMSGSPLRAHFKESKEESAQTEIVSHRKVGTQTVEVIKCDNESQTQHAVEDRGCQTEADIIITHDRMEVIDALLSDKLIEDRIEIVINESSKELSKSTIKSNDSGFYELKKSYSSCDAITENESKSLRNDTPTDMDICDDDAFSENNTSVYILNNAVMKSTKETQTECQQDELEADRKETKNKKSKLKKKRFCCLFI